ncbi:MAG: hypothetical protein IJX26_01810, partial [Clostridia bacterium]|nr:hypothetical protein [Clostridia bacterium]
LENLQIRSPYDQYKRVGIKQLLNGHIIPEIKTNYSIKGCEFYSYCALYDRTVGLDTSKRLPQADIIKTGVGENGEITVVNLEAENEILKCAKQIEDLSKEFNTIEKYIFEIVQLKKRYEKEKDLKKKKEILLKIQDKNKKLAEEVDKLDDKEKAEVFAKIKDGKFVDKKKSGIKTLEENIANLKDKTSNETLESVVNKSRENVYENAKFFNEQNRCLTIQGKEPHEITSLMPYNLSDEIGLKKIIGKDKIDNKKGKAYVNFSGKASDIAYKSLEFANVMLGATFIFPLTILAAPLCLGGFVAAAGTVAYEMVRKNIKQYRINHLTPQKIKNETNKEIENTIKSEITKAKKEMKEALKTARQNISDLTELKEAENKIYKVYKSKCLENVHQLKLLNDQIIDSPYNSAKDKKIDVKNLFGFAQAKLEKRNIKHGEKFNKDINAYNEYLRKRKECKEKIEKEENILKFAKDKQAKININNRIKAYKADYESLKHQYLAEHGPLDKRISHLKSTKEYKLLSKTEKEEKLKAKQTEVDDLKKGVKVEKVSVKGLNDDKITQKAYELLSFANKGVDKETMPMPELEEKKQLSNSEKENKKLLIAEKLKKVAQEIFKREEGKIHISVDGQCLDETGDKTVEELAEDIIKRAHGNIKSREELLKAVEELKGSEVSSLAEVVKVVGKMIYTGKRDLGLPLEENTKKSATILDVPRKIIDKLKPKSSKSSNGRTA